MEKRYVLKAPAKINLHLQVGLKRADGFHDINSLFIMVDLFDEINAGSLKTGNDCRIKGNFNCTVEENLIYKAWSEFCRSAGECFGIEFLVSKNIPSGAGMGGGSSDAAAALKLMNLLFDTRYDDSRLADIGGRIGSDVPFFFDSPAALIGGRGESVNGIKAVGLDLVAVHPGIGVSTGEAYRWVDELEEPRPDFISDERIIEIYNGNRDGYREFRNDFTGVLKQRYDVFGDIISDLEGEGAAYANVTGSGSAVFGLFESGAEAAKAEKNLQNRYKFVQKIKSLDRIPYAILE